MEAAAQREAARLARETERRRIARQVARELARSERRLAEQAAAARRADAARRGWQTRRLRTGAPEALPSPREVFPPLPVIEPSVALTFPSLEPPVMPAAPGPVTVQVPGSMSFVTSETPQGEYAFNLRDVYGPDLPELFLDRSDVTARVVVEYYAGRDAEPTRTEHLVTFEPGQDEEEFYRNFWDEIRALVDRSTAEAGGSGSGAYNRFSVHVAAMA